MAPSAIASLILAAGKGTRMKSSLPKVLHEVLGKPMLFYPIDRSLELKAEQIVAVVGHESELVEQQVRDAYGKAVKFALQAEQNGTAHAVQIGLSKLRGFNGKVLILSGDVPLLSKHTLKEFLKFSKKLDVSFLSAHLDDATGYGRVVRKDGQVLGIVEHKDASPEERELSEINAGIYLVDAKLLKSLLKKISSKNAQGEFYLTDIITLAKKAGKRVDALAVANPDEVVGANNRVQLAWLDQKMRESVNNEHMMSGVTCLDPKTTRIESSVKVGQDSILEPQVFLRGQTKLGRGVTVGMGSVLTNAVIADGVHIKPYSVIDDAEVKKNAVVGPFTRLRPAAVVGPEAHVGNFVELKKTTLGKGAKANHLAYLGDADIGAGSNVGAGTITCNYDGVGKYKTELGRGVFVGSNATLVAPLAIENNAYVAAGSTITDAVGPSDLAFGRARQINKKGRAKAVKQAAAAKKKAQGK